MTAIRIDHLTRRFGDVVAVDDVSLEIADGEFLVLLGPSGCGKSTLLRSIAGLLDPTGGRITAGERDITHLPPKERDLAMVFQSYALYPHLNVERNLGFGLKMRHTPRAVAKERVRRAAELLDLTGLLHRKPKELSGGQRQRVALGRAIVREPNAFLMDEPLSNLDAKLRSTMRTELIQLHQRLATTFIYVTHDQVDAMTMADRVALLNNGRLEQVGSPVEVYDEPATTFVAGFLGSPPMNLLPGQLATREGVVRVDAPGVTAPLWTGETEDREVVLGIRPEHLVRVTDEHTGPRVDGVVVLVENLGNEEIALCTVGEEQVRFRGSRPLGVRAGDQLSLGAAPERLHVFDRATGRRLTWVDDRSTAAGTGIARPRVSDGLDAVPVS